MSGLEPYETQITQWHEATPDNPIYYVSLHEHLGFTWQEYKRLIEEPMRKTAKKN